MIRNLLMQVLEREGFNDEVNLYFNEDNLIETGCGGALKFVLEVTNHNNEELCDGIVDVIDMEFSIVDLIDLNSGMFLITMEN